ncbi:MAG: DUF192 domain-containing protein [Hyphomicrobium sp.]
MIRFEVLCRAATLAALLSFGATMVPMISTGHAQTAFRKDKLTLKTSSGEHVIAIEVAETNEQKSLGLMYRPIVPPNTGMLFPYGAPQEITMWMRNTYASLDMIFLKSDGTVHRVEFSTEPMSERIIGSKGLVSAVLEVAAGEAKRLTVKPGDLVEHAIFKGGRR